MLSRRGRLVVLLTSVFVFISIKCVIDSNGGNLSENLQLLAFMCLPIAGGTITFSFCSLLGSFTALEGTVVSSLLKRLSEGGARNFLAGFLGTAYLYLIRPSLAVNLQVLPYAEWVALGWVIYVMYTATNLSADEVDATSKASNWKKHIQEIKQEAGSDFTQITSVMEQFVDCGVKEPLLIHLTLYLQRLGETEEAIFKTLNPLINYRESARRRNWSYLILPWRRKVAVRNKKDREGMLRILVEKLMGCDEDGSGESKNHL